MFAGVKKKVSQVKSTNSRVVGEDLYTAVELMTDRRHRSFKPTHRDRKAIWPFYARIGKTQR